MAKKVQIKTQKTKASASGFISGLTDKKLQQDCRLLLKVFQKATGLKAKMWGSAIIGFGEYTFHRSNGDEGQFLATGFSPRKSGPVVYIMPGFSEYGALLKRIGPHKKSRGCLYLKDIGQTDLKVLESLISRSLKDLKKTHQTTY